MKVAGRVENNSSSASAVYETKSSDVPVYDLWDEPAESTKKKSKESDIKNKSKTQNKKAEKVENIEKTENSEQVDSFVEDLGPAISFAKASKRPTTMTHKPIILSEDGKAEAVRIPEEGKSYNPSADSWRELLEAENEKEEKVEEERQRLLDHKSRIEQVMRDLQHDEEASDDEEEYDTDTELKSVNQPVMVKTKTKAQRNKEKRHKERLELEQKLKSLKKQIKHIESVPNILKQLESQKIQDSQNSEPRRSKRVKLGKYNPIKPQLEIKLSDELNDSLRLLKPEGNLVKDRFRSIQERGLIEPRVPVPKRRRYAPKITEKWSHKDIK